MNSIPRQNIDEIVTKYEFHPELVDIYVEGKFDRDLVVEYLDAIGRISDVSVYAIDEIDVSSSIVESARLTLGSNKSRVMALAYVLKERLNQRLNVACVVDADLERFFEKLRTWEYLLYTDYTSMEMYFLNDACLRKFLKFTCNLDEGAVARFKKVMAAILPAQFCMRCVIQSLDLCVESPSFTKGLQEKRDLGSFDEEKFVEKFIQSNSLMHRSEEIRQQFRKIRQRTRGDVRHCCNGHDFVSLLFEFSWIEGGLKLQSKDSDVQKFGSRLVSSVSDLSALGADLLFRSLGGLGVAA